MTTPTGQVDRPSTFYITRVSVLTFVLPAIGLMGEHFAKGAGWAFGLYGKWFIFSAVGLRLFLAGIKQVIFAAVWTILMPSWPGVHTYFRGLLGMDQRTAVAQTIAAANLDREVWTKRITDESIASIQADPALMQVVRETGHAIFGDNCAACHGANATGGPGFPNIAQAPT